MNLLEIKKHKKTLVKEISKYKHECRLHGIKCGVMIEVVSYCFDMVLIIVDNRENVAVPKEIARYIKVEMIV